MGEFTQVLSKANAAYLGAFFDGEGSAFFAPRAHSGGLLLVLSFGNTHRGVIEWIQSVIGLGGITERNGTDKARPLFQWRCFSRAAVCLLEQIAPYVVIKRDILEFVLSVWRQKDADPKIHADCEWRKHVLDHSRFLNRRGPKRGYQIEREEWARSMQELKITGMEAHPGNTTKLLQVDTTEKSETYSPFGILGIVAKARDL